MDDLSVHQRECLARGQVYWPPTRYRPHISTLDHSSCIRRSCYPLLSQGPCGQAQWLVLDTEAPAVVCRARVCPCDPAMPDLCEVSRFMIIKYGRSPPVVLLDVYLDVHLEVLTASDYTIHLTCIDPLKAKKTVSGRGSFRSLFKSLSSHDSDLTLTFLTCT